MNPKPQPLQPSHLETPESGFQHLQSLLPCSLSGRRWETSGRGSFPLSATWIVLLIIKILISHSKNALLLSHLGQEGLRSSGGTPEYAACRNPNVPVTYDQLWGQTMEHFRRTHSILKTRFDFASRWQEPGESIKEYVQDLQRYSGGLRLCHG